jgi:Leucine-rich repeat (LRR) protein
MPPTTCATREELSDLSLGKLAPQRLDEVAEHLEACSSCQVAFASLDTVDDTLFTALRPSGDDTSLDAESALQQGLARIRELGASLGSQVVADEDLGTIRDYQLLAKLGAGGMGTVYKALHMQLEKVVALKLLPADRMHPEAVARFKREMKAVGKLHHAHIVQAFDAGEHDGRHFLVMELVDGADLAAIVRGHGPLKMADACEAARQTALALEYVRQHGMVHRDIKPSNLVINTSGQVKVLDLGLARLHDPTNEGDELTSASQAMGTADYLAPEQIGDSHSVDIRADLYALGCTLYKLLAGEAPYADKRTAAQKMVAHLSQPFPDVRAARPEVSANLKAVLDRLVAKEPTQRYATPAEVATALAPFCSGHDLTVLARVSEDEAFDPPAPTLASATGDPSLDETSTLVAGGAAKPQAKAAIIADGPYLAGNGDWFSGRKLLLALAAGGLALLLGIVVLIQTRSGTLVLKVEGPDDGTPPVIKVDGKTETAEVDKDGKVYRIRVNPGKHELLVTTPDGTEFGVADKFSMSWGGETKLTARLERREGSPPVADDADRRAAEYVLRIGANLHINDEDVQTKVLPKEPFRLTAIEIWRNPRLADADLAVFRGCRHLKILNLGQTQVGEEGLAYFKECSDLEALYLSDTQNVNDAGLIHFRDCNKLKYLHLGASGVSDVGLAHFKDCKNLIELAVNSTKVTAAGVAQFKDLKHLTVLHLQQTPIKAEQIGELAKALPQCKIHWDGGIIEPTIIATADADRRAALWTLSVGGLPRLKTAKEDAEFGRLPPEPFELVGVGFHENQKVNDAGLANFQGCKRLRSLRLHLLPITEAGLANFKDCKQLTSLHLSHVNVGDGGLSYFQGCQQLKSLHLDRTQFTAAGLAYFKECEDLAELNLNGAELTDAGLANLQNCRKLTRLTLSGREVTDAGAVHFKNCKALTNLELSCQNVTEAGLAHFQDCQQLTDLVLTGPSGSDESLSHFEKCKNLKHVTLMRTKVSDAGLERLAKWPQLQSVTILNTAVSKAGVEQLAAALPGCRIKWDGGVIEPTIIADADRRAAEWVLRSGRTQVNVLVDSRGQVVEALADLPQQPFKVYGINLQGAEPGVVTDASLANLDGITALLALRLNGQRLLTDAGVERLASYPGLAGLTSLTLFGAQLTDKGLAHVKAFHKLKELDVGGTAITSDGVQQLANLPELSNLVLRSPAITGEALKHLRTLPLTQLNVGTKLTDADLAHLDGWKLHTLNVDGNRALGDAGMAHLSKHADLARLYLSRTQVGDGGLEYLKGLKRLELLYVDGTKVTDGGLELLHDLESLKNLNVVKTKVTDPGIKNLAAALPSCRIEWDGGVIEPKIIADADRRAAEWALSIGGVVDHYGGTQLRKLEDLPQRPFEIASISLRERRIKDDDLQRLQGLTKVAYLDLHACGIGNVGLTHLESLSSLTSLELSGTNVSAAALESLQKLPKLNALFIGGTKFRPSHYQRLAELPALVHLSLGSDPDFGNEEAKSLQKLPAIESLLLNYSNVGDEGLREVARLPSLRQVHLQACPVTGAGLSHLAALPKLQVLDVGLTKVSDEGLEALADYPALEQFLAFQTPISDRGLEHLARAKGLKYVALSTTAVTAEGIAKLQKALPRCKIEWDGGVIEPAE